MALTARDSVERPITPGDRSFEDFFEAHSRGVAAYVAVVTGDRWAAEDATQEAFARALVRWPAVARMDRPDLWVRRVASRCAIDAWQKRQRAVAEVEPASDSPATAAIRQIWVRWGLEHLSPPERAMFILRHAHGLSVAEVGTALDYSPHTVAKYLKRSARKLRALFGEDHHE